MSADGPGYGWYRKSHYAKHGGGVTIPRTPPPIDQEAECRCPSCESEGYFWQSPHCKWWRADCEVCRGAREYVAWSLTESGARRSERLACDACEDAWSTDVKAFREALRGPIPEESIRYTETARKARAGAL